MKILIFLPSLALGGAERQAILLARHYRDNGHSVVVYGFGQFGTVSELCQRYGIPCNAAKFPLDSKLIFGKILRVFQLLRDLSFEKPDLILSYCMSSNVFMAHLWHFTSVSVCLCGQRDAGIDQAYLKLFPLTHVLCSGFVSNSKAGIDYLSSYCCDPVLHIPNAVYLSPPEKSKDEWRTQLGVLPSTVLVTMIANLSQNKEHDLLLYAWMLASQGKNFPSDARLVLVGRFDDRAEYLQALACRLNIVDSVIFTGFVQDISGILATSNCAIFASMREGLPNGVLEAMGAGLPVVALDIAGTNEALGGGGRNILVVDKTPRALATALCDMLADPGRCKIAGAYNKKRVENYFSEKSMFNAYDELLLSLPRRTKNPVRALLSLSRGLLQTLPRQIKDVVRLAKSGCEITLKFYERIIIRYIQEKKINKFQGTIRIGMAVLVHNRADYLSSCLDSLFLSDYNGLDITFLLHDDGSTDPSVHELLNKSRDSQLCIYTYHKCHSGKSWGAAFNSAMQELLRIGKFDILICCDSDALFHPNWLQKSLPLFLWAKANHRDHRLGPFSSFNSSDKDFHKVLGCFNSPYGQYWVKEQMGALVYFWTREDFERWGKFEESKDDETRKTAEFRAHKIRNFCSATSYVEHIGQDSVLNRWRTTPVSRAVYGLHLTSEPGWPEDSLRKAGTLGYYREVVGLPSPDLASSVPLAVLIPAVCKDLPVLPLTIQGLYRNLVHPICEIIVAAPAHCLKQLRKAVINLDVSVVDERELLPCPREDIIYKPCGVDRSGWLAQQVLKLHGAASCEEKHCLVIDADTVLVRPQTFEQSGKFSVLLADEYHAPYYDVFQRFFGYATPNLLSCVAHMMLFKRSFVGEMILEIESRWGVSWYDAVLLAADKFSKSGFSEFETYGHWMQYRKPDEILLQYFFNKPLSRSRIASNEQLEQAFGCNFRSVSFQSYINNERTIEKMCKNAMAATAKKFGLIREVR